MARRTGSSDAVDYTRVASAIRELSDRRALRSARGARHPRSPTLLMERFSPESLRLRVRKPQVEPAGMTVEYSAVTVERP